MATPYLPYGDLWFNLEPEVLEEEGLDDGEHVEVEKKLVCLVVRRKKRSIYLNEFVETSTIFDVKREIQDIIHELWAMQRLFLDPVVQSIEKVPDPKAKAKEKKKKKGKNKPQAAARGPIVPKATDAKGSKSKAPDKPPENTMEIINECHNEQMLQEYGITAETTKPHRPFYLYLMLKIDQGWGVFDYEELVVVPYSVQLTCEQYIEMMENAMRGDEPECEEEVRLIEEEDPMLAALLLLEDEKQRGKSGVLSLKQTATNSIVSLKNRGKSTDKSQSERGKSTDKSQSERGKSTDISSSERGKSTVVSSSERGKSIVKPSNERGKSTVTPSSERGKSTAIPSSERGKSTAIPSSERGKSTVTSSKETNKRVTLSKASTRSTIKSQT